jgi:hypothetical protein
MTTAANALALQLSSTNVERLAYVTIPPYSSLTEEQRQAVDDGGPYPVMVGEHLPEHEAMLDYLIERALTAWSR